MNRHGSMNRIYRLVWSAVRNLWIPAAETARGRGKRSTPKLIAAVLSLGCAVAQGSPSGGQVVAGTGSITQSGATTTITQATQNLSLTWASFNIAPQQTVNFVQTSPSAIAVNRILGTNGTQILGYLHANGQIFLINPNGIVFGPTAEVNVGGLVASTLDLNGADTAGNTKSFSGTGTGSVVNQGTITTAQGGFVALLGNHVSNEGVISAQLGTVALGAGSSVTLTFLDNSRVRLQVDQSVLNSLAENGGLIRADGGQVIMSAGAKDALLASVVNNGGVIEARNVDTHDGTITLLGGMTAGTVRVGGTLDASAPEGGNGGQINTSAAYVDVAGGARVTTAARDGLFGSWLIDPQDFTVASSGGDVTGAALSSNLGTTNIALQSSSGTKAPGGSGSVNVNDAVTWSANTTLTLTAADNVNVNANISASGNTAGLIINPNTTNGSGSSTETLTGNGTFNLSAASISLSGTAPHLSIAGTTYTVINTLGASGSLTATNLQGMNGNLAANYALGTNIDASPTATTAWNNTGAGFTPIGTSATPFVGTFEGLGHTISNLTINLPTSADVGLFGYTGSASIVQNVGLVGGNVNGSASVGELIGTSFGTVRNSYATGSVIGANNDIGGLVGLNQGGAVSGSHATGNVTGGGSVGGLVGFNQNGVISESYSTGTVANADVGYGGFYMGGLVGFNYGGSTITNSFATGAVSGNVDVGGLVGASYASAISSSRATGTVTEPTSRNADSRSAGGLVGFNYGGSTIINSFATGVVTGESNVGGLVGENGLITENGIISNSYATGRVIGGGYPNGYGAVGSVGGLVGSNSGAITSSYATGSVTGPGAGAAGSTGGLVGFNRGSISNSHAGTGSVNASSPDVGGLVGYNYAGNNHTGTVTNSYATGAVTGPADVGGLLGYNASGDSVVSSYATGTVTGTSFVGGLVGANYGAIATSHASGAVSAGSGNNAGGLAGTDQGTISSSYATGAVSGGSYVGGLVGSAATEGVEPISNSYATGAVSGAADVGGLVGQNEFTITNSYATGSVHGTGLGVGGLAGTNGNGGTISNSYATGTVTSASSNAGGLVGYNYGGISNTYASGSVSGTGQSIGGLVGLNSNGGAVNNSYATGSVTGGGDVGGLVGNNLGTVMFSFWNDDVVAVGMGSGVTAGAQGLTSVGTMTLSNFASAGWSISDTGGSSDVWRIYEGNTAPLLLSFLTPLTVTAQSTTHAYTGTAVAGLTNASYSVSGATTSGHIFNLDDPYDGAVNVGTYATDLYSDQQGYDISVVNALLTLTPATLTVTATGASRPYGQVNPTLSGNVTGFVGGDTLTSATTGTEIYSTPATTTSNVGAYAVTGAGLAANNGNYIFSFAAANAAAFTITPATLTVSGEVAASRIYNGTTDTTLTGGSLTGMVSGDTVALTQAGHLTSPDAGTAVPVAATDTLVGAGAGNYVLAEPTDITANIAPATLTYTAAAASFTAGQTPSGLSGTLTGFVAGETQLTATTGSLTWITTAGVDSAPGRYAIDGNGLTATNYVFVDAAANATALTLLTATVAPLNVQNVVTSIEANLPSSQTNIQLAMLDVPTNIAGLRSLDVDPNVASDSTVLDERSVHRAMVPSLRVMRGGVRLPEDALHIDLR